MAYTVIVEERAKADIREAARWMAQYSSAKATLWHFEIEDAIVSLERLPNRCPLAPESRNFKQEIRHLLIKKYRVLFTVQDEMVHILSIRHSAQDYLQPDDEE